jgi:hypothetical protein
MRNDAGTVSSVEASVISIPSSRDNRCCHIYGIGKRCSFSCSHSLDLMAHLSSRSGVLFGLLDDRFKARIATQRFQVIIGPNML